MIHEATRATSFILRIVAWLMIIKGAMATFAFSFAYVTINIDPTATNETVRFFGVLLCVSIAVLIGGLILREKLKPKAIKVSTK